jgi:hypothetical protein
LIGIVVIRSSHLHPSENMPHQFTLPLHEVRKNRKSGVDRKTVH